MQPRTKRSIEENLRIDENYPHVPALLNALKDRLVVERCGRGQSVLQVYLSERTGSNEYLLLVYKDLQRSFVSWAGQSDPDVCRRFWNNLVKNPRNKCGSELKPGLTLDRIANVAIQYADEVADAS